MMMCSKLYIGKEYCIILCIHQHTGQFSFIKGRRYRYFFFLIGRHNIEMCILKMLILQCEINE